MSSPIRLLTKQAWWPHGRPGVALILTLLLSLAITGMALGAVLLAGGAQQSTHFTAREAALQSAADGGLEIIRDSLNRGVFDSLLPDSSFTTIASAAPVRDARGATIPNVTRSLYVGRTGGRTGGPATAGQYGSNFASAVSIISDRRGAIAARRLLLTQESWAKYAVAVNDWSGSGAYGCAESVNGPLHSNSGIKLVSGCTNPKTRFAGPVTVVGSILHQASGNYLAGVQLGASVIPWPTPARIALMRQYAQDADAAAPNGDYDLIARTNGSTSPALRIEFVVIDVNGNGIIEPDEGFMRVWTAANTRDSVLAFATGRQWPTGPGGGAPINNDPNMISRNCGAVTLLGGATHFWTASTIFANTTGSNTTKQTAVRNALTRSSRRCYLGGDPHIYSAVTADSLTPDSLTTNTPIASNNFGWWRRRRSGAWPGLTAVRAGDAARLIPLEANPNFKGVIFVQGDVAISGRLRGRVTVFATGNIIMADDVLYHSTPGSNCGTDGDILGLVATRDVVIEDNNLQTPFEVGGVLYGGFDDTNDANYNAFFLAAGTVGSSDGNWYGEWVTGSGTTPSISWTGDASAVAQHCGDAPNGCVRVSGGMAVGRVDNATYVARRFGWGEAHTYDPCGAISPPPYFPTTGRFTASRYYELDPVWLNQLSIPIYFGRLRAQ
jgi:hypothetical protein